MSTSGAGRSVVFSVRGNGATLTVAGELIGFRPTYLKLVNETTAAEAEWFDGMEDAKMFKRVTGGTGSVVTSGGITVPAGAGGNGFALGADGDLNNDGDLIRVRADG